MAASRSSPAGTFGGLPLVQFRDELVEIMIGFGQGTASSAGGPAPRIIPHLPLMS